MVGTFWAFVPAIVAIALALITKHVYISLFVGIFTGAMFLAGGNPLDALGELFTVMSDKVGGNVPIIVFLVVLGIFVILMQKSGGARAYGSWASGKVKSKKGVMGMTAGLGCLIFMDDYFNCLTVGSVMRPLTDKYKVSRSKLAYIIDSTAAPVCIIAPISSWAAAVAGELEGNSLMTFIKTIPFNVYAILTIVMVFTFIALKLDFGKMRKDMRYALKTGDVNAGVGDMEGDGDQIIEGSAKGKVRHIVVPIIILIVCCIGGMIYTGFFYNWGSEFFLEFDASAYISSVANADGTTIISLVNNADVLSILDEAGVSYLINADQVSFVMSVPVEITAGETVGIFAVLESAGFGSTLQSASVIEAFSNCDAGLSLAIGSTIALVITCVYYAIDKIMSFKDMMDAIPKGFKTMVPAILILVFAWTISGIMGAKGGYLDAQAFVKNNIANSSFPTGIYPAVFFILACAIAFSTGTSWGTFGVLVPIAVTLLGGKENESTLMIMTISACLGGAVFGDHVSPISDTTILASAGANCNHVNHVRTQIPYAGAVAAIATLVYIPTGFLATSNISSVLVCLIMWAIVVALFVGFIFIVKRMNKKADQKDGFVDEE